MKDIRHIFFDLDHTLWDFDRNAKDTIGDLLVDYRTRMGQALDVAEFYPVYKRINDSLWKQYRENRISSQHLRRSRFRQTFDRLGINGHEDWVDSFGEAYMEQCPLKPGLIPMAIETLDYLQTRFELHIITNGFSKTQKVKMEVSGLDAYFDIVITSELAGAKKPSPKIFEVALSKAGAQAAESVIIGDNYEADIFGGLEAGLHVIWFNPHKAPNPLRVKEIQSLDSLRSLFS